MPWRRPLAYITGSVDEKLRPRNEYLAAENKILRAKLTKRIPIKDTERSTLTRCYVARPMAQIRSSRCA